MIARIKKYFRDIQLEWQKVSKPDWKDVRGNTIVVIVACVLLAVFLWLVDGTTTFPKWYSIYGMVLVIVGIPLSVYFISRALTPQWKIATAISFLPLVVILISQFVFNHSLEGFGMVFLRGLFLR
jgi:preprotein translocase SecE subunit